MLKLHQKLHLTPGRPLALIGGGGKTTCALTLARESARAGFPAAVYATTHIGCPEGLPFFSRLEPEAIQACWHKGLPVVVGEPLADSRLTLPDECLLDWLQGQGVWCYIEADGSKQMPLKFPAVWEPALPGIGEEVLLVAGLSALGQRLSCCCQRWPLAAERLGLAADAAAAMTVNAELMANILSAGFGHLHPRVLLNQADSRELYASGEAVAAELSCRGLNEYSILSLQQWAGEGCDRD